MMSVLEYAEDVNRTVESIISKCKELNIEVNSADDLLDEEAIILLDNSLETDEEIEEAYEEEAPSIKAVKVKNTTISPKKDSKSKKIKKDVKKDKSDIAKEKKAMYKNKEKLQSNEVNNDNVILYKDGMTIGALADALGVNVSEIIKKLFTLGLMVNINSVLDFDNAEILVEDYGKILKKEAEADISNFETYEAIDSDEDLEYRPPVVTIMGHVDHGKTTLLDAIRRTDVVSTEAGGITQAISAYQVSHEGKTITFIDTPGHAAFTEMRARGASITDIVIIIVAADDGVMPQTKEAIDHAKAAGVPILVAINKIDKPDANPDKVMQELGEYGLMPEEWGGDIIFTKISAATGEGIDELLENIILVADMQELKANPNRYAIGTVVESRLNKHVGPIVTVLIQNGTLRLGDPVVVGTAYGKIRIMKNDKGEEITFSLPSQPVEITGLNEVPSAGDKFMAFESEKQARSIAEERKNKARLKDINKKTAVSLDALFSQIGQGLKEIKVVLKADVNGSLEAVKSSLEKIDVEGVKISVIRGGVGAITESDVVLASASDALIIGFNVRGNIKTMETAKQYGISIKTYDIIYKLVEDMESAMKGMLDPEYEEKVVGTLEIRQIFKFSKVGLIAGCHVLSGVIRNNLKARIIRDDVIVYNGAVNTLQHEKDQVKEVKKDMDCGITLENCQDYKEKDIIEVYELVEIKR